jgi:putative inorganic carbon (hco3(-)) transporter
LIYYGLLLFFVFEYVRIGNFVPGANALHLNSLLPLGVFVASVFAKSPVTNRDVLEAPNTRMFLILLGLIAGSTLVAVVTMPAVEIFITVLGYVLIYYVIVRQATTLSRIKGLFAVLILVHLMLVAMTPAMLTDPSTRHYMASGTFLGDGNDFALSATMTIPLALFLFSGATSTRGKLLASGALLLLVLAVVATQSRGGTLALGSVGLYYWFKSPRKALTAVGVVVALATALSFAPPRYFERMNTIATYETDGSAQGRLMAWKAGTEMMLSNPLFGVGAGQFSGSFVRFAEGESSWKTAHSVYFLILGELGLPGIVLLICVIARNLSANRRVSKRLRAAGEPATSASVRLLACLSASLIAYAVGGAFLSATYYPHMFVFAGLMTAGRRLAHAEQPVPRAVARTPVLAVTQKRAAAVTAPQRPRGANQHVMPGPGRFF